MNRSFLKRVRRAAVLFGGLSLICGAQAFGQDVSCSPQVSPGPVGCGPTSCAPQAPCCDQLYEQAGQRLAEQLECLTAKCCAPDECGVGDGCGVMDECGTGGCGVGECGDGCGWCNLGEPFKLFDHDGRIDIGGWTQWGYHSKSTGLFNSHPNQFNNHQSWLYAERVADGSEGLDWGFRADMMYGVDAADTQAFGNRPGKWDFQNGWDYGIYGWALPQLYAEVAMGDLSVKAGHFYTLVGYEVVTAPDNFFYSHAYTMYNSEPFTHTGAIATYTASDNLEVYFGWTAGWDTGFDQNGGGSNFLGGFSLAATDKVTVTYITTAGNFGGDPKLGTGRQGEGYSHSVVVDTAVTEKFNWVFQSDLVETNAGDDHQVGINQYFIYTINDCLGVGSRVEWWKNDGVSFYEVTWGVNVRPHANLVLRPEIRKDWSPANDLDQTLFGIDAILTF